MRAKEFVIEYKQYPTREYEGVTFTMMEKDGQLIVKALNDFGLPMGHVVFGMDGKELDPKDLEVYDKYQGQGIARVMYDYIKSQGFTINRSFDQTDAGRGFWDKHRGEDSYVWEDRGQGAAGIVLYAEDTGRYGLQQRSDTINDPGVWAAWGGGREPGETLEQCARRELAEEGGYTGPIKLQRLGENSKYVTFLGTVPHEFEPRANDEWQDFCWVEAGDWPSPMHPGVTAALRNIPVKQNVAEAFDQPYKLKWEKSEYGDYDALAKLDDGTYLSIMFNLNEIEDRWMVEFYRNNSQALTGEGDAQRIFATVLTAVGQFIQKKKPQTLFFSAVKEDDPTGSRTRLYDRLVQRYANNLGYTLQKQEYPDQMAYKLTQNQMQENFADGKVQGKSRPGRVKRAGASCAGSVTDLRAKAKKYGGERGKMYHWCANMKSGKK